MVGLFSAVVIGNIVLVKSRCHAVQEGQTLSQRIVFQHLEQTTRSNGRINHAATVAHPLQAVIRINNGQLIAERQRMIFIIADHDQQLIQRGGGVDHAVEDAGTRGPDEATRVTYVVS